MEIMMLRRLYILGKIKLFLNKFLNKSRPKIISVPISQCRHYCGFRYGTQSLNPYEHYITGLHQGKSIEELRKDFEDFLSYYRPQSFGDVLGLRLSKHIPLWLYPWSDSEDFPENNAWLNDIDEIPDVMTHFCSQGIKRYQIEREYFWLERAYKVISSDGYKPLDYSYIEAIELQKENQSVFIITDGNHRLSSLSVIGFKEVEIKINTSERIKEKKYRNWKQISTQRYTEKDALDVFYAYFNGVSEFKRSDFPTTIID
jgi:hypothetical protein